MSDRIRIAGLVNDSITDGPGLRMTIFLQGCGRRCEGCHNPSALDVTGGIEYTVSELWQQIEANPLLSGVTLSGGEPLLQAKALLPLAEKIKSAGLDLAVYTGYTWEEIMARDNADFLALLQYTDTLVDGHYVEELRSLDLAFRGSSNQRVLNVPESLKKSTPVLRQDKDWLQ